MAIAQRLTEKGFTYDAPPAFICHLGTLPELPSFMSTAITWWRGQVVGTSWRISAWPGRSRGGVKVLRFCPLGALPEGACRDQGELPGGSSKPGSLSFRLGTSSF